MRISLNDEIIMCASYLYQFMKYRNNESYNKFKQIFIKLDDNSKNKVINYYLVYKEKQKEEEKNSKNTKLKSKK